MLYIPGGADPSFRYELDRLVDDAAIETTPDGFDYFVVERGQLTVAPGVAGETHLTGDNLEVTLVVDESIDQEVRPTIVDICLGTIELFEEGKTSIEGLICEAASRVATEKPVEHIQLTATNLQAVFDTYRRNIAARDRKGKVTETHPDTRAQLRHSLGWTAFSRPINEQGLATIDTSLADRGIYMPYAETGQVLRGEMKLPQGKLGASCYFAVEKSRHGHTCKPCGGEIFSGNSRLTVSLDKKVNGYDHHHYHPVCFAETDMSLLDPKTLSLQPLPEHLKPHYGQAS